MTSKKKIIIFSSIFIALLLIIVTQLTIFIIPPIGAIPEGATIIMLRLNKTDFIDSPDAMCERIQGSVNLLCRGMVLGAVGKNSNIIARLPYSKSLYLVSTSGKTYSN